MVRRPKNPPAGTVAKPIANWLASRVDATLEIIRRLDSVATADELGDSLLEITSPLGVEAIVAGVLPSSANHHMDHGDEKTPGHWPALLTREALAQNKLQSELLIDLEKQTTHIFTRDAATGEASHLRFVYARDNDAEAWPDGERIVFPIVTVADMQCGFAFLGANLSRDETAMEILSFIANYAFARMVKVDRMCKSKPKLTDRQSEVLKWAALGKTDWEIAAILDVSQHTVDKYMRQSKEALNAVNRTAAIVLAMRYGLIS